MTGPWGRFMSRVMRRPLPWAVVSAGLLVVVALPAARMHTKLPNLTDLPQDLKIHPDLRTDASRVPGLSDAGGRGRESAECAIRPDAGRVHALSPAGTRDRRAVRSVPGDSESGQHRRPNRPRNRRQRRRRAVESCAAGAAHRRDPTHRRDIAGHGSRCHRNHRRDARLQCADALTPPLGVCVRAWPRPRAASTHLPVARHRGDRGRANLLSAGAAYGDPGRRLPAWLARERCFGFQSNGAIVSWIPLFPFVVLFGLSMDYHVFVVSRIKELQDHGRETCGRRSGTAITRRRERSRAQR